MYGLFGASRSGTRGANSGRTLLGSMVAAFAAVAFGPDSRGDEPGAPQVAIVTTVGCKYCIKTKAALRDQGIPYLEIDLDKYPRVLSAVKEATGLLTVPQVFVSGQLVGGADDTLQEIESGAFKQRLAGARPDPLPPAVRRVLEEMQAMPTPTGEAPPGPLSDPAKTRTMLAAKQAIREGSLVRDVAQGGGGLWGRGVVHTKCFRASEAAKRLITALPEAVRSAEDGLAVIGDMLKGRMLQVVDRGSGPRGGDVGGYLLRFAEDAPPPQLGEPLNAPFTFSTAARPAVQVSQDLRRQVLKLYGKFLSEDGRKVDYAGMGRSQEFADFVEASAELQAVDPSGLPENERKAFFINLYNIMIVHANVVIGAPKTASDRMRFFPGVKYNVGGLVYSADDIEHGILRCNRPTPASLWALLGMPQRARPLLPPGDRRLHCMLHAPVDPRIHFALVCGAKSCPPIRVFDGGNVDRALAAAAEGFLENETQVDERAGVVTTSMILKWYGFDFGQTKEEVLRAMAKLMREGSEKRAALERMLANKTNVTLKHAPYDWGVNS